MARTAEPELSPPTSPAYDDDDVEDHHNPHLEDDEDLHDLEHHSSSNRTSLSSPPTSVDPESEKAARHHAGISGRSSLSGLEDIDHRGHGGQQSGNFRLPSLTLSQFSVHRRSGEYDDEDGFQYNHGSPIDDPESQWESEAPISRKQKDDPSSTSGIRSRKSPAPSSKIYPRSSRHSGSSSKLHLHPSSSRRQGYYASRASSASYEEPREEKKAPLVLLHITLLLLPGAEEAILRKITPTTLERGLLIEHPRGDYQMLEELIFDSLGLDEESGEPEDAETRHANEIAAQMAAWEKSMGVRPLQGKKKWEVRVYAANGLMTQGAWKRVWPEMERIDVEVGPKGWRGKKTDELIRGFLYNRDSLEEKKSKGSTLSTPLEKLGGKGWVVVAAIVFLLMTFGAFWKFNMMPRLDAMDQLQVTFHENATTIEQIVIPDNEEKDQNIVSELAEEIPVMPTNGENHNTLPSEKVITASDDSISQVDASSTEDHLVDEQPSEAESTLEPKPNADTATPLKCLMDSKGELVLDSSSSVDPDEDLSKGSAEEESDKEKSSEESTDEDLSKGSAEEESDKEKSSEESTDELVEDSTIQDSIDKVFDSATDDNDVSTSDSGSDSIIDSDLEKDEKDEKDEKNDNEDEKSEDSETLEQTGSPLQDVFGAGQAWWKNLRPGN